MRGISSNKERGNSAQPPQGHTKTRGARTWAAGLADESPVSACRKESGKETTRIAVNTRLFEELHASQSRESLCE